MNLKTPISQRIRLIASILVVGILIIPFQNCGGGPSTGIESASSTTPPPPNPTPTLPPTQGSCPQNSNPAPTGSVSPGSVDLAIGMGPREGNGPERTVTVNFNSGDGFSRITAINCQAPNNSGLALNCNLNTAAATGQITARINVGDNAECLSGPITVTVRATDVIYLNNAPDQRCSGLTRNNATIATFTVNRTNACLRTQRVNPMSPYSQGLFGTVVAIDGTRAVASAPGDEQVAQDAGAAFVMERGMNDVANPWMTTAKLLPSGLGNRTNLTAAALSGDTIALGSTSAYESYGGVWIFQYDGNRWVETRAIVGPSQAAEFGKSVAVSGNLLAVGAPGLNGGNGTRAGAVYVYNISTGQLVTTLTPVSQVANDYIAQGEFGASLAFSGNRLVVGAPFPNSATNRRESVYIYDNLTLTKKIRNTAGVADRFGYSVSLDGNNLAVGAPYFNNRRGRAYLFVNNNGFPDSPTRTYNIPDPNDDDIDSFGHSVAVRGTRVVVGAPAKADPVINVGAVYLYSTANNTVQRKIRAYAQDRDPSDQFGYSVGVSNDGWLISGAFNDDQNGYDNSGAVYFVSLP